MIAPASTAPPWRSTLPLAPPAFAALCRQAIFDCCKWDPQVEDVSVLAPYSLLLESAAWDEIAGLAETLAAETLAAEAELVQRPELHSQLGLPRPLRRALLQARGGAASPGVARVMRFDFHATMDGWRISEVNSDVPGGFNEASGFSRLMASHVPGGRTAGDPAARLAEAVCAVVPPQGRVALVHATAYTDDRQVMVYLGREIAARGCRPMLAGPDQLRWREGRAWLPGEDLPVDFILRFFPAEWLPNLPRPSGWTHFFHGARTPLCNPAAAILTQSKRFPLVWDRLATPLPTWRDRLPATCDPRAVDWKRGESREDWVLKPALGRVGDGIGIAGATAEKAWKLIHRDAAKYPAFWAAQRRFTALPLRTAEGDVFPCIGVYTIDGRAAGAYGRAARRPLIDHLAQDVAVLLEGVSA